MISVVAMLLSAGDAAAVQADSVLRAADVVVLEEPEGEEIGQPVHVAVDDEGRIAVVDRLGPSVMVFTVAGERIGKYGSRGAGPGETNTAVLAAFVPEDRVGVIGRGDYPRVDVFEIESGAYVETIRLLSLPSSITPIPEGFLFGTMNFGNRTALTEFSLSTRHERPFGPLPAGHGYVEGGPVAGIFSHIFAVPLQADGVAVGYQPLSEIVLVGNNSAETERFEIPAKHRRGTPEDLEERIEQVLRRSYVEVVAQGSILSHMAAVGEGRILLVHQDARPEIPAVPEAVYITVVDVSRREACLDIRVPSSPSAPAVFTSDGERLGVVQQELDLTTGRAPAVLRWYQLDLEACSWEPLLPIEEG